MWFSIILLLCLSPELGNTLSFFFLFNSNKIRVISLLGSLVNSPKKLTGALCFLCWKNLSYLFPFRGMWYSDFGLLLELLVNLYFTRISSVSSKCSNLLAKNLFIILCLNSGAFVLLSQWGLSNNSCLLFHLHMFFINFCSYLSLYFFSFILVFFFFNHFLNA